MLRNQTRQQRLIAWLGGKDQVRLKGKDVDLRLSLSGRSFLGASGKENFPDGEIYTSPVEGSVNGWIRFAYPCIYDGREVMDVELWFEDGKISQRKSRQGTGFSHRLAQYRLWLRLPGRMGHRHQLPDPALHQEHALR